MTIRQKLEALATEKNTPCVTISLNTHRTHPDNAQDVILLKNLLKEAEERVIKEFDKRPVSSLLENYPILKMK
jgi:protein tyrosine/serine phosphatase